LQKLGFNRSTFQNDTIQRISLTYSAPRLVLLRLSQEHHPISKTFSTPISEVFANL